MTEGIKSQINESIKAISDSEAVDKLLGQFPEELQERLETEIGEFDDKTAVDYLYNKLLARRQALVTWGMDSLPEAVEVVREYPLALIEGIEEASEGNGKLLIAEGKNGKVVSSVRREDTCYKVLFLERAKQLGANIIKETVMQYEASVITNADPEAAHIPTVFQYVVTADLQAFSMQKIKGYSIEQIFNNPDLEFPPGFDPESFFAKLIKAVQLMHEKGYYHRDLTNNAGNVIVDEEGQPWIVDFGSAVKAFAEDNNHTIYQLYPNGPYVVSDDISGITGLKQRVNDYIKNKQGV